MSRRDSKNRPPASSGINPGIVATIAVAAFAAGSGVTWYFMPPSKKSGTTPTYVIQTPAAPTAVTGEKPLLPAPDAAPLTPAQSALELGNANYDRKNWAKAVENYQQALALGMDNPDVRTDLGNAFRFSSEPQKALEQYQIARRENPRHENSLYNMAALYSQVLNDPVHAVTAWREYLQRFPTGEKAGAAREMLGEAEKRVTESVKQP